MTTLVVTIICGMLGLFDIKHTDEKHRNKLNKFFYSVLTICILFDIVIALWLCNKTN